MRTNFLLCIAILFFLSCATQGTTPNDDDQSFFYEYDEETNETCCSVGPNYLVLIPGKWNPLHYREESSQLFLVNEKKLPLTVRVSPCNGFEFNKDNSKQGFDFIKAFHKWEYDYYAQDSSISQELIQSNAKDNYIICRVHGKLKETNNYDNYFIYIEREGILIVLGVMSHGKMNRQETLDFIKTLYPKMSILVKQDS